MIYETGLKSVSGGIYRVSWSSIDFKGRNPSVRACTSVVALLRTYLASRIKSEDCFSALDFTTRYPRVIGPFLAADSSWISSNHIYLEQSVFDQSP